MIKRIVRSLIPRFLWDIREKIKDKRQLNKWKRNGCPAPSPHIIKQTTIKEYQNKYQYEVLVETGTYMGKMVEAQKKSFKEVYSIELGIDLFNKAKRRFRKDKNVTILQGDSGIVLHDLMFEINEPAIFWLDGHYSAGNTARGDKDCPIFEELDAIFSKINYNHILLIDDARCFIGEGDYPTLEELTHYIKSKDDKYHVDVKHDIIRFAV
jgi:hypothetical protein